MKKKLRIVKDECSFDVDKFKYSSQKKFLTKKQNNNRTRGNETFFFLAPVSEFVHVTET